MSNAREKALHFIGTQMELSTPGTRGKTVLDTLMDPELFALAPDVQRELYEIVAEFLDAGIRHGELGEQ